MALREKAGGPNSVISPAEAKKLGLAIKPVETKITAKPIVDPSIKSTPKITTSKVNIGPSSTPANKKTGKEDELAEDPIASSLAEREKAGGVTQVVAEKKGAAKLSGSTLPKTMGAKPKEETKSADVKTTVVKEKPAEEKKEDQKKKDAGKPDLQKFQQAKTMKGKKKNPDEAAKEQADGQDAAEDQSQEI